MPGFGFGPFGSDPFGEFGWSKQVLFRDLPEIDRRIDAQTAGNPLETTMAVFQLPFDDLLRFTRDFGDLRDALRVRTLFTHQLSVNLIRAVPAGDGRTIEVLVDKVDPTDPFEPLFDTSIGWVLESNDGREFIVNAVHKLREAGPTIELQGAAVTPSTALSNADPLTGTVQFVNGSTTVVGVGTAFLAEVAPGQLIAQAGSFDFGVVLSVTNNFSLELTAPYSAASTGPGRLAVVATVADGSAVLRPPSLIEYLGADFGIDVDRYDPEAFQRSSVFNVEQWLNLKGTERAYDIIGKIAGYRVVALGLWRIGTFTNLSGTVSFMTGSNIVTGVGTAFLTEAISGLFIAPGITIQAGVISTVIDDFTIQLSAPYAGPTVDTESAVMYETPIPSALDVNSIFESPVGSGKVYTTTDPVRPNFDEVAADVIPLDYFCFETPDWTTDGIEPPSPPLPDGTSVDDAIGSTVQGIPVLDTDYLGDNRWRVRVGPGGLQIVVGINSWFADFAGTPGTQVFVETVPEEQLTPLTGTVSFTNGSAAVSGVGTAFLAEVAPGQFITLGDDRARVEVQSITDNFNLTLVDPYPDSTMSGPAFIGREWDFEVVAPSDFVFGASADFGYECRIQPDGCGYCRASVIRVEVVPVEILTDPQALLDRALDRLVTKVIQVVPAHVRLTDIVQILGPVQALMDIQIQASVSRFATAFASAGFYFDVVPADELPLDQDHYVATGSVSTTP